MPTIPVEHWEEFEDHIREIKSKVDPGPVGFLYRGQADADWSLNTTLERLAPQINRVDSYYSIVSEIQTPLETFTELSFQVPSFDDIQIITSDYSKFSKSMTFGKLPGYQYLIYLRHHGFPSPLLDWSRSPYVASYFAFAKTTAKYISIDMFADTPNNIKV